MRQVGKVAQPAAFLCFQVRGSTPTPRKFEFYFVKIKNKKIPNNGSDWVRTLVGREQGQTKHAKDSTRPTHLFCNKTTKNNIYWFKIVEKFGYLSIQPVIRLFVY